MQWARSGASPKDKRRHSRIHQLSRTMNNLNLMHAGRCYRISWDFEISTQDIADIDWMSLKKLQWCTLRKVLWDLKCSRNCKLPLKLETANSAGKFLTRTKLRDTICVFFARQKMVKDEKKANFYWYSFRIVVATCWAALLLGINLRMEHIGCSSWMLIFLHVRIFIFSGGFLEAFHCLTFSHKTCCSQNSKEHLCFIAT